MIKILMILIMGFVSIGKFNPHLDVVVLTSKNIVSESIENEGFQEMNVDGSVSPVLFKAAPNEGEYWMVSKFLISLSDMGNFVSSNFGTISGGLSNGVSVLIENREFVGWKDNGDIATTGRVILISNPPETTLLGEWEFTDYGGSPNTNRQGIRVDDIITGITCVIRDDLTGLSSFRCRVEGQRFKKPIN